MADRRPRPPRPRDRHPRRLGLPHRRRRGPLAILNLGGVANLTWLGPTAGADRQILACDTGPGNAALDDWALRHTGLPVDRDGALARAGHPHEPTLARLLTHPFFSRTPPKSLDRQDFATPLDRLDLSPADGAATLTEFTARAVAATLLPEPPRRWLVCGGGRHNPALMDALRRALPGTVEAVETLGWDGDALEAQCFGFLAARVARGLPLSLPGTTGVPEPSADHPDGPRGPSEPSASHARTRQERAAPGGAGLTQGRPVQGGSPWRSPEAEPLAFPAQSAANAIVRRATTLLTWSSRSDATWSACSANTWSAPTAMR